MVRVGRKRERECRVPWMFYNNKKRWEREESLGLVGRRVHVSILIELHQSTYTQTGGRSSLGSYIHVYMVRVYSSHLLAYSPGEEEEEEEIIFCKKDRGRGNDSLGEQLHFRSSLQHERALIANNNTKTRMHRVTRYRRLRRRQKCSKFVRLPSLYNNKKKLSPILQQAVADTSSPLPPTHITSSSYTAAVIYNKMASNITAY